MKIIDLVDCSLGVNTDMPAEDLPPGAWSDASGMRFSGGVAQTMKGIVQVFDAPAVTPYFLMPYQSASSVFWIHAGLAKIYCDDGTTRTELTGTAPTGGIDDRWTGGVLGGVAVLNNGVDNPMYWGGNVANNFATLTGWDTNEKAGFMRPWRTFLLAGDITKTTTRYPHMLKLSDAASPGTIPSSWDETNPALDAVERDAAQTEDYLVDMIPLGDMAIIYKQRSMYFMRETFDARVVELQRIDGEHGMLYRGCGVATPKGHVVLTAGDVIVYNGETPTSIADKAVRASIFAGIDETNYKRCFVAASPFMSEAWVCFPTASSTTCNKAAVWDWNSGKWTFRSLPNLTYGAFGRLTATISTDVVDSNSELVDTVSDAVDSSSAPPNSLRLLVCNASYIGVAEVGNKDFGSARTSHIERRGLRPEAEDVGGTFLVTDVMPKITGVSGNTVTITVGSAMSPSADYSFAGSVTYTIGTDFKADIAPLVGRYFSVKVSSTGHVWSLRQLQVNGRPLSKF